MTTEALTLRGMERENLLGKLFDMALAEEEKDPVFLYKVARALLGHVQQRKYNAPRHDMDQNPEFFNEVVFPEIQRFARSQAEEDSLFADFLEHIVDAIVIDFYITLRREEEHNPQLIFQAPSAMSEVPLQ